MKLWIHNESYLCFISALREGVLARIRRPIRATCAAGRNCSFGFGVELAAYNNSGIKEFHGPPPQTHYPSHRMVDTACTSVFRVVFQFRCHHHTAALSSRASLGERRTQMYGWADHSFSRHPYAVWHHPKDIICKDTPHV